MDCITTRNQYTQRPIFQLSLIYYDKKQITVYYKVKLQQILKYRKTCNVGITRVFVDDGWSLSIFVFNDITSILVENSYETDFQI